MVFEKIEHVLCLGVTIPQKSYKPVKNLNFTIVVFSPFNLHNQECPPPPPPEPYAFGVHHMSEVVSNDRRIGPSNRTCLVLPLSTQIFSVPEGA